MVANGLASPLPLQAAQPSPHKSSQDKVWRGEVSVQELESMAMRQQEEMASQRALLAAKEQRLRALKHQQEGSRLLEQDRLRRLRDRVQAQENKLSKLRALRGQLDHTKLNNATLTSDLDSIKALFNEKEKELTMAVAKVEELTRQLEEVRRGKGLTLQGGLPGPPMGPPSQLNLELDRLRRELMYRNKVNEEQSVKVKEQREALCQRQAEMANIDKRIAELQERLHRKRLLNQQLANQINQAAKQNHNNNISPIGDIRKFKQNFVGKPLQRNVTSGNIAAIEPYHHIPNYHDPSAIQQSNLKNAQHMRPDNQPENNCIADEMRGLSLRKDPNMVPATHHYIQETRKEDKSSTQDEFILNKADPKYQTLPYNTKFSPKIMAKRVSGEGNENISEHVEPGKTNHVSSTNNVANINYVNNNNTNSNDIMNLDHNVGYEPNKNISVMNQQRFGHIQQQHQQPPSSASSTSSNSSYPPLTPCRSYGGLPSLLARGQPVGGASSTTSSTSSLATTSSGSTNSHQMQSQPVSRLTLPPTPLISDTQKPVNAVPPTMPSSSSFYQTTSIKVHPIQPQTINSHPQVIVKEETETSKPALPPKPMTPVKATPPPPPRQTHAPLEPRLDSNRPLYEMRPLEPKPMESRLLDNRPLTVLPPPDIRQPSDRLQPSMDLRNQDIRSGQMDIRVQSDMRPPNTGLEVRPAHECRTSGMELRPPNEERSIDFRPNKDRSELTPEAVDSALSILRGATNPRGVNNNKEDDGRKSGEPVIKPRPLTIKKQPSSDMPRLKNQSSLENINEKRVRLDRNDNDNVRRNSESGENKDNQSKSRRIDTNSSNLVKTSSNQDIQDSEPHDDTDRSIPHTEDSDDSKDNNSDVVRRIKKGNLKGSNEKQLLSRRVSFDPLALLLDAALEGELELVMRTAGQVRDPSAANDEGITALHNAICAGHLDIVTFLVEFGCDVNAQDSDGWTPLHCAASCNNLAMVKFLVEHGACIFATTLSDHETAAEKCEEDEEGFDGCSEYLYSVQEKLGILNGGNVYAVYDYEAHNNDELSFKEGDQIVVIRKGDEWEREWWWARLNDKEGYIPKNLLGLYSRVHPQNKVTD